jgi:HNH endonuclease
VWSGVIGASEDDESSHRKKGRVPARRLSIRGNEGEALEVLTGPAETTPDARLTIVREIGAHRFDDCPICLTPAPSSVEHVPPAGLGGHPRTWTCEPCNNALGSRVEAELIDWRDDALRHTRATTDGVPGPRRLPRLLRRRTPDGQFVLIIDGPLHPGAEPMLKRDFSLLYTPPDPRRYKLAALKHAYLAACLDLCAIPDTPCADVIWRDLRAARDAPSRASVPVSEYAMAMPMMRTHEQPREPSIALGLLPRADGATEWWIALASSIAVPWPLPDRPPVA